jgi:hypothetical protein
MEPLHSFFGRLGLLAGIRQQENQLSPTFQACFLESPAFSNAVIDLLWRTCRVPGNPRPSEWDCTLEQVAPVFGGGRPDIRLERRDGTRGRRRVFHLESKVESELALAQLVKYRNHGVTSLIAITKYPPAISARELRAMQIRTVRWQDVHRAMRNLARPSLIDRFLCHSFAKYLEETGMAYDEELTGKELRALQRLLKQVSVDTTDGLVPTGAFGVAERLLRFLRDLEFDFRQRHETLTGVSRWGPGYVNWKNDKATKFHVFECHLFPRRQWSKRRLCFGFRFPENDRGKVSFRVRLFDGARYREQRVWLRGLTDSRGVIDQSKVLKVVRTAASGWRVRLQPVAQGAVAVRRRL